MKDNSIVINLDDIKNGTAEFKKIMLMYNSALKEIETKVNILSDEFQTLYKYNPIEHIKTRVKTPESIIKKMERKGMGVTYNNMVNYINDVAGIRIICSFLPDIYRIVEMFERSEDLKIIEKKDYIKTPKASGYSSFHLIVLVPVTFSNGTVDVKVEIQIRTIAMDFWASLEHKIKYKYENGVPKNISKELISCARMINKLDTKMSKLGEETMKQLTESMEKNEPEQINQIKLIEKLEKVLLMNSEGKKNEIR
ncbi:MAG: GTP pyrophosphokinase family protein [Clostridia bacterium]|nr:GTP pyrophosphokinase family protein [Clostridia bacterium]